jgi:HEAT repeat protein
VEKRLEALQQAARDPDPAVRHAAVRALSAAEQAMDIDRLVRLAQGGRKQARLRAIYALQESRLQAALRVLGQLVGADPDSEIRATAASCLSGFGMAAAEHLRAALSDPEHSVAEEAIRVLAHLGSQDSVQWIIDAARERPELRDAAIEALGAIGEGGADAYASDGQGAAAFLADCIRDGALEQQCAAAKALAHLSAEIAQDVLIRAAAADHPALRRSAVEALGSLRPPGDGATDSAGA